MDVTMQLYPYMPSRPDTSLPWKTNANLPCNVRTVTRFMHCRQLVERVLKLLRPELNSEAGYTKYQSYIERINKQSTPSFVRERLGKRVYFMEMPSITNGYRFDAYRSLLPEIVNVMNHVMLRGYAPRIGEDTRTCMEYLQYAGDIKDEQYRCMYAHSHLVPMLQYMHGHYNTIGAILADRYVRTAYYTSKNKWNRWRYTTIYRCATQLNIDTPLTQERLIYCHNVEL